MRRDPLVACAQALTAFCFIAGLVIVAVGPERGVLADIPIPTPTKVPTKTPTRAPTYTPPQPTPQPTPRPTPAVTPTVIPSLTPTPPPGTPTPAPPTPPPTAAPTPAPTTGGPATSCGGVGAVTVRVPGPLHGTTWVRIVLSAPDGLRRETTESFVDKVPWEKTTAYVGWPSGTTITPYLIENGVVIQTLPTMTVPRCP